MISVASRRLAAVCAAVLFVAVPAARAQSLADVARAEQARRKEQPKSSKVYTNDSVKSDITPSAPASAAPAPDAAVAPAPDATAGTAASGAADASAASTPAGQTHDKAYWSGRIGAAREQLERSKTFAEALQTRINALSADFVNRDDPAQQSVIGQNRTKAVAEYDRVQREIAAQTKAIAAIEDEARRAGVPAGWLR